MKHLHWILLITLAVLWAITVGTGNTINFTSWFIMYHGIKFGVAGLLFVTLVNKIIKTYSWTSTPLITLLDTNGNRINNIPLLYYFKAFIDAALIYCIIFYLSILIGRWTGGFYLLERGIIKFSGAPLSIILKALLIANCLVFLVTWVLGFLTAAYHRVVSTVIGFSVLVIIILCIAFSHYSGFSVNLANDTDPMEELQRESQKTTDSIRAANNAAALQKKKDAEAKQLADAAAKAPKETADNGAAIDQGDPTTTTTPATDQEIVTSDGTKLINKNGHQAIMEQPDEK